METKLILHRLRDTGNSVLGVLSLHSEGRTFDYVSLEPSDFFNVPYVSCIPDGEYSVKHHTSPKFGKCLLVEGVPGRTNILIHAGNYYEDTEGCIIVGLRFAHVNKDGSLDVKSSKFALEELLYRIPAQAGCTLIVQRDENFQSIFGSAK